MFPLRGVFTKVKIDGILWNGGDNEGKDQIECSQDESYVYKDFNDIPVINPEAFLSEKYELQESIILFFLLKVVKVDTVYISFLYYFSLFQVHITCPYFKGFLGHYICPQQHTPDERARLKSRTLSYCSSSLRRELTLSQRKGCCFLREDQRRAACLPVESHTQISSRKPIPYPPVFDSGSSLNEPCPMGKLKSKSVQRRRKETSQSRSVSCELANVTFSPPTAILLTIHMIEITRKTNDTPELLFCLYMKKRQRNQSHLIYNWHSEKKNLFWEKFAYQMKFLLSRSLAKYHPF